MDNVLPAATLSLHPDFTIGELDPRVFGSFIEHMGRAVYTGLFEPDHPDADEHGFRSDVRELIRELGITVVRYPGGNFVSGYRWEDGVGPVEDRPTRLDLAWGQLETNHFGLDEFVRWGRSAGVEPMIAVNLGTRGVQEACDLLEYANHPGGTYLSDQRISNGSPDPHAIRLWCLGNEMDGPWQIGHKTAHEYGRLANETAKAMRLVDPNIELVLCGSSNRSMPTFGEWEATALEHAYDSVDYLSLHTYFQQQGDDLASFLASSVEMDDFIEGVRATADHIRAKLRKPKKIMLSFDEWNVWYQGGVEPGQWTTAPRISEEPYTAADAVVVGACLITLLRHADRVRMACLAQLVNTIAPIHSEPGGLAWRKTTFHPFALTARWARGTVLRVAITSPDTPTEVFGQVPVLDAVVTLDPETGDLAVFCVNRSPSDALPVSARLGEFGSYHVVEATTMDGESPRSLSTAAVTDDDLTVLLPPASWTLVRLAR